MYFRIIRNDISKSKLITFTTMIFIAAAAMLVSLAVILVVNLAGAIDNLMLQAKTPHFLQMHTGEINLPRLSAFSKQNGNIDEFQVIEFLNVDGSQIVINGKSLSDNVQDNGFTTQSKKHDYLLDLNGNIINPKEGELYVPICYMKDDSAKLKDKAVICGRQFNVAGFLRDSQMNSLLASSKRFLISENDYKKISGLGSIEYLIEFRLKDIRKLGEFETSYTSAGLEANGPTITYPLFKTINAISDGMMIAVLLLVSVLVVAIAFMCIRFTLLAKIEDDYREIGVMKAIGISISEIRRIYLAKYAAIAATGCILGYLLSLGFKGILLENIRLYMGESRNSSFAQLFGIIGVVLVFIAIITYVTRVLKRFRKISAAEAIRFGISQEKPSAKKYFCLSKIRILDTNIFLGVKDVLTRKRLYATMLLVLIISAFIIIVPQNLYNTISQKSFSTYMGIGNCDMRIDIQQQQVNNLSKKADEIIKIMDKDSAISKYALLTTKTFIVKTDKGSEERLKIELGDHSVFPVKYSEGRAPLKDDEIALSSMNAGELGKKTGDRIKLVINGITKSFTLCGIYSDITNGGKTAKAVFKDDSADIMWSVICVELKDKAYLGSKVSEYSRSFPFAKVTSIDQFTKQTFGATINSVRKASYAAIAVALAITMLITLLFIRMLISKDRYSIAVMKAFGFTNSDLRLQYVTRAVFVLIIGIIIGTLLANTVGRMLAGAVISQFGASSFKFAINPLSAYLLNPLMMVCAVLIAAITGSYSAGQIKIFGNIKE